MTQKITVAGRDYEIDIDDAIKKGCLKHSLKRHTGQIYVRPSGTHFILSSVGEPAGRGEYDCQVTMISLTNGNRWVAAVNVLDKSDLTNEEWDQIADYGFSYVAESFGDAFTKKKN